MSNKKQNEELQSRREFFKKAAKAALPVVGAVVLSSLPNVMQAAEAGCQYGCSYGCEGCSDSCYGSCKGGCNANCIQGNCSYTCTGGCKFGCSGYNYI